MKGKTKISLSLLFCVVMGIIISLSYQTFGAPKDIYLTYDYSEVDFDYACSYYTVHNNRNNQMPVGVVNSLKNNKYVQLHGSINNKEWEWRTIEDYTEEVLDKTIPYNVTYETNCTDNQTNTTYPCKKTMTKYNYTYKNVTKQKVVWRAFNPPDFKSSDIKIPKYFTQQVRFCADIEREWTFRGYTIEVDHIPEFNSELYEEWAWWNSTWLNKKNVTITENSGGALSNYAVLLNVTYDSDMKSDFSDLRFVNSTGSELNYWVENFTASTRAWVWVNVTSIPSGGTETIIMYYNNSAASSTSDVTKVAVEYEDCEDNNVSDWTINAGAILDCAGTVISGNYTLRYDSGPDNSYQYTYKENAAIPEEVRMVFKVQAPAAGLYQMGPNIADGDINNDLDFYANWLECPNAYAYYDSTTRWCGPCYEVNVTDRIELYGSIANDWGGVYIDYSDTIAENLSGSLRGNPTDFDMILLSGSKTSHGDMYFDDFAVFASVGNRTKEPTYTFGSEESPAAPSANISITAQELYPASPNTTVNLTLNITCNCQGASCESRWQCYNESVAVGNYAGNYTVSNNTNTEVEVVNSADTTVGEDWYCECWCGNSTYNSSHANTSARTIQNTAPTVSLNAPSDDANITNLTVSFNYTPSDPDNNFLKAELWIDGTSVEYSEHLISKGDYPSAEYGTYAGFGHTPLADITGDGVLDSLSHICRYPESILIAVGNLSAESGFNEWKNVPGAFCKEGANDWGADDVIAEDLDGDDQLDIIVGTECMHPMVCWGNHSQPFGVNDCYNLTDLDYVGDVEADFVTAGYSSNSSYMDIFVGSEEGILFQYKYNSSQETKYNSPVEVYDITSEEQMIESFDYNGDNMVDIIYLGTDPCAVNPQVYIFLSNSSQGSLYNDPVLIYSSDTPEDNRSYSGLRITNATDDINHDNLSDIIFAGFGGFWIMVSNSSQPDYFDDAIRIVNRSWSDSSHPDDFYRTKVAVPFDYNQDDQIDILLSFYDVRSGNASKVYLSVGNSSQSDWFDDEIVLLENLSNSYLITAGDINNDGYQDFVNGHDTDYTLDVDTLVWSYIHTYSSDIENVAENSTGITNDAVNTISYTLPAYGSYEWNIKIYDNETNAFASSNFTFTVSAPGDSTNPSVTIDYPTNTTYNFNTSIDLNYTVSDDTAVDKCWYNLDNGANITLTSCANATFNTSEAQHTLYLFANDSSGNTNDTETITFTINTTSFVNITIQHPTNTTYTSRDLDLNFTLVNITSVDECWYEVGGSNISISGLSNRSMVTGITNGTYFNYTSETEQMPGAIEWHINNWSNVEEVWCCSSPEDNCAGDPMDWLSWDRDNLTADYLVNITKGWNCTVLMYHDHSMNLSHSHFNVPDLANMTYNNDNRTMPEAIQNVITNWTDVNCVWYWNGTFWLSYSPIAPDWVNTLHYIEPGWVININTYSDGPFDLYDFDGNCNNRSITFSEGMNTLKVYANDTGNNITVSSPVSFTVNVDPIVTLDQPTNTSYMTNVSLELNYTVLDAQGIDKCWYSLNDGAPILISNCNNITINVSNGQTLISINANDTSGNNAADTVYFTADGVVPAISFDAATTAAGTHSQSYIDVNVTASDNLGYVSMVANLYNSGGLYKTNTSTTSPFYWNITGLPGNTYYLNATATDGVGHTNSTETRTIILNISIPAVTINQPTNITYSYNTSIDLNYTAVDPDLDKCWYKIDAGSNIDLPGCVNTSINVSEGHHTVYVYANNSYGNTNNTESVGFSVDTIVPHITISAPTNTTYSSSSVGLTYTTSADADQCKYELDGSNTTLSTCQNTTLTSLSNVQHIVKVWANDSADNWNVSTSVSFTVDTNMTVGLNASLFDEWSGSSLSGFNITIYTTSESFNYSTANHTILLNCTQVPTGPSTIKIEKTGYESREYIASLSCFVMRNITAYLLPTSRAQLVTFIVRNIFGDYIAATEINASKTFGGGYTIVGQSSTDTSGSALFYLNPETTYQFTFEKATYDTVTLTLKPILTQYIIVFNTSYSSDFDDEFDDITYRFEPFQSSWQNDTSINIKFIINSTGDSLEYFGLNVTYNGTSLYYIQINETGGGTANYSIDLSGYNGTINAMGFFKKTGFGETTLFANYTVWAFVTGGYTLKDVIAAVSNETHGIDATTGAIMALFLMAAAMGLGGAMMGSVGAGFVGFVTLVFITMLGAITWGLFLVIGLTILSLMYLMERV